MKIILGLDLGTTSIGWALVNEAESETELSSIVKLGVRVNPLSADEKGNFLQGKALSTNGDRTMKRGARRNLQRFKHRRDALIEVLKQNKWVTNETILSETGNHSTFETYRLRAKAVSEEVTLEQLARILLMINKKRGYKSNRKVQSGDEGKLLDGMEMAKKMYEENLTPGEVMVNYIKQNKKIPEFYRSDYQTEFLEIWNFQKTKNELLTDSLYNEILNKGGKATFVILRDNWQLVGRPVKSKSRDKDTKLEKCKLRIQALSKELDLEDIAIVLQDINDNIASASGYLGNISDRSKVLYFGKQTVGQYLLDKINNRQSVKNNVFYRLDYSNEFDTIWEKQAKYHKELTSELKHEIRDIVIFYQRRLKSQKGQISFCELEQKKKVVLIDGKQKEQTIGARCIPRSSLLFQEFKIWQILNNVEVFGKGAKKKYKKNQEESILTPLDGRRRLLQDEMETLAQELQIKEKMTKSEVLKLLFENPAELDLNYESIEGNHTMYTIFKACLDIVEDSGHNLYLDKLAGKQKIEEMKKWMQAMGIQTDILDFDATRELDSQSSYQLWHLLYSFEGDNSNLGNRKLMDKLHTFYGIPLEYAPSIANITFKDDYGNLSAKAIRNILPHLKDGNTYDVSCLNAGYNHSKSSQTREQLDNKALVDKLEILPKNSLRNPVVEKILNQMVNVVNTIVSEYGRPDEIRIELARELKKNAKERESLTVAINKANNEHKEIRQILEKLAYIQNISRNDIIKYKLYKELEPNGFKTLYSNTPVRLEELFTKKFDIEHIIPQARLFDDSFSNKTIELRDINLEKGADTAADFILRKYGKDSLTDYITKIESLFEKDKTKRTKLQKLKMKCLDIPDGFVDRDIRDTQYIAKKAKAMLEQLVKTVLCTSGSVTDRLREDWQLVDVMKELNWDKYQQQGLTEVVKDKDGRDIRKIKNWTKRNDHRHHAMDALTVAFTRRAYIQYLNNLNARRLNESDSISNTEKEDYDNFAISTDDLKITTRDMKGIEKKYLVKDKKNKLRFNAPLPLDIFRQEAKKHMEALLVSVKAKNKVVTKNKNIVKIKKGTKIIEQLTPRGQLHKEKIYAKHLLAKVKIEKIGASFDTSKIQMVCNPTYRELLLRRLKENDNDPKKAFGGKNSLSKSPIFVDALKTKKVPESVKTKTFDIEYTIRTAIEPSLSIDKVIDEKIQKILQARLDNYGGDAKKAFVNLDENPIWLNKSKGIDIRKVRIKALNNAIPLHKYVDKSDVVHHIDFVNTGNNHHVAIYMDESGYLQEDIVTFYDAVQKANSKLPIVNKEFNLGLGWKFQFTMKQNEYFVFPNDKTGFDPNEIDLMDPDNYAIISPNLFRVQKFTNKDYVFRHHLETTVADELVQLKGITWDRIRTENNLKGIIKVRINHIGQIVSVGEE